MLTEEEKQKIREELEYRQLVLDELRPEKGRGQKFSNFLAHPVIITIVGGLVLSAAAAIIQHRYTDADRALARQVQVQDMKYALLEKCCGEIECAMTEFAGMRKIKINLESPNGQEVDALGRSPDDVRKLYAELTLEFTKNRHPLAVLHQVRALCGTDATRDAVGNLMKTITTFESEDFPSQKLTIQESSDFRRKIDEYSNQAEEGVAVLATCIAEEIKGKTD